MGSRIRPLLNKNSRHASWQVHGKCSIKIYSGRTRLFIHCQPTPPGPIHPPGPPHQNRQQLPSPIRNTPINFSPTPRPSAYPVPCISHRCFLLTWGGRAEIDGLGQHSRNCIEWIDLLMKEG